MGQGIDSADDGRAIWYALVIEGSTQNAAAARVLGLNKSTTNRWKRGAALRRARAAFQQRKSRGTIASLVEAALHRHRGNAEEAQAQQHLADAGRPGRSVAQVTTIDEAFELAAASVARTGCEPWVALTARGVPKADAQEWQRRCEQEGEDEERWSRMTSAFADWEIECRAAMMAGSRGQHARLLEASIPDRYTPRQETVTTADAFLDDADRLDALSKMYGDSE